MQTFLLAKILITYCTYMCILLFLLIRFLPHLLACLSPFAFSYASLQIIRIIRYYTYIYFPIDIIHICFHACCFVYCQLKLHLLPYPITFFYLLHFYLIPYKTACLSPIAHFFSSLLCWLVNYLLH